MTGQYRFAGIRNVALAMLILAASGGPAMASDAAGDGRVTSPVATDEQTGLQEHERQAIYRELVDAEWRASQDSMIAYPMRTETSKQVRLEKELADTYRGEVATRHGIDEALVRRILDEGKRKSWPAP